MKRIWGVLVLLTLCGTADAQNPNYILSLTTGASQPSGSTVTLTCFFDVLPGAADVQGWSYGVCHDFTQVMPVALQTGDTTLTSNDGNPPGFLSQVFYPGDSSNSGGVTQAVVISLFNMFVLPPGTGYELLHIDYDLVGPNGTLATVQHCDGLFLPGAAPMGVDLVIVVGGASVEPTTIPTEIEIEIIPSILEIASIGTIAQGDPATIPITLTNSVDIYGFSFGVEHDPAALSLTSVTQGADLLAIQMGGADFFQASLSPTGGSGFTIGTVFSLSSNLPLSAGTDLEVVATEYTVLPNAPVGETQLSFSAGLSPPGAPAVAIAVSVGESSVTPVVIDGTLTVEEFQTGIQFIRGDSNSNGAIDISDGVSLLDYLFGGGPTPPCLDAADAGDDGQVNVADPISLLNYLFASGPNPASPFPGCGLDPSGDADSVTCLASNFCP